MQLDISCVRSILLTVEKYETIYESVSFDENIYTYYDDYLSSYDFPKILYHVQYCIKAGLLSDVCSNKIWGRTQFDCCLEPLGMIFSQIPGPKKSGVVHKHLYQKPAMQV